MIIVSQNKEFVINFDNVEYLQVVDNRIICSFVGSMATIGEYKTNAIAQKVLEDVVHRLGIEHHNAELPEV